MTEAADCYVYYKLPPAADAAALAARVRTMQAEVARLTGARPSLHARLDGDPTWMEIYLGVADRSAFSALLSRLAAELPQPRKEEWFRAISAEGGLS